MSIDLSTDYPLDDLMTPVQIDEQLEGCRCGQDAHHGEVELPCCDAQEGDDQESDANGVFHVRWLQERRRRQR